MKWQACTTSGYRVRKMPLVYKWSLENAGFFCYAERSATLLAYNLFSSGSRFSESSLAISLFTQFITCTIAYPSHSSSIHDVSWWVLMLISVWCSLKTNLVFTVLVKMLFQNSCMETVVWVLHETLWKHYSNSYLFMISNVLFFISLLWHGGSTKRISETDGGSTLRKACD